MRRTASWGSRDAFTDGHISSHAVPRKVPTGRRTLSATTKAHRSKRCHTTPSQQRSSFSDTDADQTGEFRRVEALNDAAARRRSAPEAPQNRLAQQDPSKLSAVSSDDSTLSAQSHGQPTIQARAAIARAVLGPHPNAPHASDMHLRAEQPRQQDVFSNDERGSVDTCRASAPPPTSEPDHGPDQHVRLSYANIQRNLLMPYGASTHLEQAPADSTSSRSPLMALPEDAPVDYGVSSRGLPGLAGRRSGSPESKPAPQEHGKNIRPSMEARTRRLGSSALQVWLPLQCDACFVS